MCGKAEVESKGQTVKVEVELPKAFVDELKKFIAARPGSYDDVAEFIKEAARLHFQKLRYPCC